ncbi:MAG: sigma-70 family RNA polymerase sigma factor [Gemmatimonadetes bacterium]|nr:sigma-70 family RNA polymerase sigma factor [Gemmatimonadota bacterium]
MRESERQRIFDDWMRRHRGLMLKVVRAWAFAPDDQEDLFQEVALQLWQSIPNYRADAAETTWLYRVALYTAFAWNRRERKHSSGHLPLDGMEHTLRATPAVRDDRLDWLYREIAELGEVDRSVMLLMLDGHSYREMSDILGISESNVGVRIHRIRKRFAAKAIEGV